MKKDKILKTLEGTIIDEEIEHIVALYNKLEKKQENFCNSFDIHCEKGCGKCCEHFTPDISETEALFLAYGLIKEGKEELVLELLNSKKKNDHHCPLYIKDSDHHCSVYKWRPLVCRLFSAAASEDKNGCPTFKSCKWNKIGHDVNKEEFNKDKRHVILMNDYGEALNEMESDNNKTVMLYDALPQAINKIKYYLSILEENER